MRRIMAIQELFVYLCVPRAQAAIDFYARAFGAREKFRLVEPSGRVGHAELSFGAYTLMLSEEFPEHGLLAPATAGGLPFCIHLHVDDADAVIAQAVSCGAALVRPPQDEFYGERGGRIRDPFGYDWLIGHQIEEVAPAEMQRRYTALFA